MVRSGDIFQRQAIGWESLTTMSEDLLSSKSEVRKVTWYIIVLDSTFIMYMNDIIYLYNIYNWYGCRCKCAIHLNIESTYIIYMYIFMYRYYIYYILMLYIYVIYIYIRISYRWSIRTSTDCFILQARMAAQERLVERQAKASALCLQSLGRSKFHGPEGPSVVETVGKSVGKRPWSWENMWNWDTVVCFFSIPWFRCCNAEFDRWRHLNQATIFWSWFFAIKLHCSFIHVLFHKSFIRPWFEFALLCPNYISLLRLEVNIARAGIHTCSAAAPTIIIMMLI